MIRLSPSLLESVRLTFPLKQSSTTHRSSRSLSLFSGKATVGGESQDVKAGDLVVVPAGTLRESLFRSSLSTSDDDGEQTDLLSSSSFRSIRKHRRYSSRKYQLAHVKYVSGC